MTIVARSEGKLQQALEKIKASSASSSQSHHYISADLSTFAGAREALSKHKELTGASAPHTVFCCAGGAKPGYFLDQTEEDFELGMKMDYWTALATSHVSCVLLPMRTPRAEKLTPTIDRPLRKLCETHK